MSKDKAIRKIASKCEQFVEHIWPHLEKRGGIPETPMNRKERGHSSPAIGDYGLRIVEANRVASRYLRFFLEELEKSTIKASNGIYYSTILQGIRYDPGALTNWRREQTDYDKAHLAAFDEVCTFVAKGVVFVFGEKAADDPDFEIERHPDDDEPQRGRTRQGQRFDTAYTNRLIVEQLEAVEDEGFRGKEAMEILQDRRERAKKEVWSIPRMRKARECVNRERRGDVA